MTEVAELADKCFKTAPPQHTCSMSSRFKDKCKYKERNRCYKNESNGTFKDKNISEMINILNWISSKN